MTLRIAVIGAAGYVGGELLRLLATHPEVAEICAVSRTHPGKRWGEVHPAFAFDRERVFTGDAPEVAAQGADVVFLALGHGESSRVVPSILDTKPRLVVDLGADFRLNDAAEYRKHYGEHPCFELCESFVYGLPEARRDAIRKAARIANPGCMATATQLAILPLVAAGVLPERTAVFAITGSSGAGQTPKPTTHHPFRASNLFVYKPLAHQHEAEINRLVGEVAGKPLGVRMIAHSGPFVRGIHAAAHIASPVLTGRDVAALYREDYSDEPFVRVLDEPPHVAAVAGTNFAYVSVEQRGDEALVTCVIDNLMKGAAGQALHNMNIALGLPETTGLNAPGVFPY
ncbi:MAG: N-acetyl-gamma-glutamyl-phosphate reductase [Deltaproteobacteria bacterium]|nr:N-acetyl-gamma-glutamyl-phosphate reductase [Deltaproteobacteria bacterium]